MLVVNSHHLIPSLKHHSTGLITCDTWPTAKHQHHWSPLFIVIHIHHASFNNFGHWITKPITMLPPLQNSNYYDPQTPSSTQSSFLLH